MHKTGIFYFGMRIYKSIYQPFFAIPINFFSFV